MTVPIDAYCTGDRLVHRNFGPGEVLGTTYDCVLIRFDDGKLRVLAKALALIWCAGA
jgi:hypothetical protein